MFINTSKNKKQDDQEELIKKTATDKIFILMKISVTLCT